MLWPTALSRQSASAWAWTQLHGGHVGDIDGGHGHDRGGDGVRGSNRVLAVRGTQMRTAVSNKRT